MVPWIILAVFRVVMFVSFPLPRFVLHAPSCTGQSDTGGPHSRLSLLVASPWWWTRYCQSSASQWRHGHNHSHRRMLRRRFTPAPVARHNQGSSSRFAVGASSPRRNDPAPDRSIVSSQRHVACDASVAAGLAQAFVCFPAKSSVRRSFRETLRVHPTLGRGGANASSVFFSVVWLWQHTIIAGPLIATPVFAV